MSQCNTNQPVVDEMVASGPALVLVVHDVGITLEQFAEPLAGLRAVGVGVVQTDRRHVLDPGDNLMTLG